MQYDTTDILLFVNFFILAITILVLHYYTLRLRYAWKRADQLHKEAQKYKELFNSTWDGVFLTDEDGRFLIINQAGAQILGYKNPDNLLESRSKTINFFLQTESESKLREEIVREGYIRNRMIEFKRKNRKKGFLELTAHVHKDEKGKIVGFEGIFRDITQRIQAENDLKAYSKDLERLVEEKTQEIVTLERKRIHLESLAALGEMVATIVHEIRNPLSSIKMGLTALLKRTSFEQQDQECVELATMEVTSLERVLNDLLNFSRPSDIKSHIQNINEIVELALAQMNEDFKRTGITIKRELAANLPRIFVDSGRLEQVFFNLLINAKDAMPNGGNVVVRTSVSDDSSILRIEILDEGHGIAEGKMFLLFEPFFSTKENGTGLGLTIVQRIIEAHGGKISIESQVGKGTTARIELPAN